MKSPALASALCIALGVLGCGQEMIPPGLTVSGADAVRLRARELRQWIVGFADDASMRGFVSRAAFHDCTVVKVLPPLRMVVVTLDRVTDGNLSVLRALSGVSFVERDAVSPDWEPPSPSRSTPFLPALFGDGDPGRTEQWYLDRMNLPRAWALVGQARTVRVAVVDTGADLAHPDLQGRLLDGYNAAEPGKPPQDFEGHGTSTAGCIGAIAGNGVDIAGAAPNAMLVPVKVSWTASSIAESMVWAADHADMISMSLSVKPASSEYGLARESLLRAARVVMDKDVPMVCSTGNTSTDSANVPAAYAGIEVPDLIAVGATNTSDWVARFSTTGPWVSVVAPGVQILTLQKGGGTTWNNGTSFATPLTAGVVALMLGSGHPRQPARIKATLTGTARDIDAPGRDVRSGSGLVDAARAVANR
ncbi:MAG: S8 family serine peptidase [Candidatus Sericytochromatia bacterium]|nr:S8 family serine peptidase [Candidatus Sericytochromatia bacterium]